MAIWFHNTQENPTEAQILGLCVNALWMMNLVIEICETIRGEERSQESKRNALSQVVR